MKDFKKISWMCCCMFVLLQLASASTVAAVDIVKQVSTDQLAIYKSGLEGMMMLKTRVIGFYQVTGHMPSIQELLETPLADKPPIETGLLDKHYIRLLYIGPQSEGPSCSAVLIQGTIYSDDLPKGADIEKDMPNLLNNIFIMNANGAWKSVCTYSVNGPNSKDTIVKLDNCYNMADPKDKTKAEAELSAMRKLCPE